MRELATTRGLPPRGRRARPGRGAELVIGVATWAGLTSPTWRSPTPPRPKPRRAPGRRPTRSSSRARVPSASRRSRRPSVGEVMIAGMAGDADNHLPRAEVHRLPAAQGVRPAHPRGRPEEHHEKAGRRQWAADHLHRDLVPYLVLSDRDTQSLAVFGVGIGCAAIGFSDMTSSRSSSAARSGSLRDQLFLQAAAGLGALVRRRALGRARLAARACASPTPAATSPTGLSGGRSSR